MSIEKFTPRYTFTEDRLDQLKQVVPEAFADGKINWNTLKEALGDFLEEDGADAEHFGLTWPGKRQARRLAALPSKGALTACAEEGVDAENSEHVFLEGDNLEVLKLMQKAYAGRVKLIYIDPPYNTGNDFVYKDDYSEPLDSYLRNTRQKGEGGDFLTSNPKSNGRFHSNYLSMMYPRIRLARNLLSEDGFFFISVDDGEAANLRRICDEIFGEENFVSQLIWKSRVSEDTRATSGVSTDHEYIVCYSRDDAVALRGTEKDKEKFSNPDNDPRGPWRSADLTGLATKAARPNLHYDLIDPQTNINYGCPPKGWRYEKSTMLKKIAEGRILFPANAGGRPRHKLFLNEMRSLYKNMSSVITGYSTAEGTREVNVLLGQGVFNFPKPTALLASIIEQATQSNDIILDFFAGSGTSGHATWLRNATDKSNRRFVLVQLPEPLENDNANQRVGSDLCDTLQKPRTIAELSKERLRRAAKKIQEENPAYTGDLGFKVFKLGPSQFRAWDDVKTQDLRQLQLAFESTETPLIENWDSNTVFCEILLQEGFPLHSKRETLKKTKQPVWVVTEAEIEHRLFVCLADKLTEQTLAALTATLADNDILVCFDRALTDESKAQLMDRVRLRVL